MNRDLVNQVNLEELALLREIAELGSITRVAEKRGVSQSSLSRRLQEVEVKLGFPVFERTTRRLALTEAGRVLLEETEAIPHILGEAMNTVMAKCFDGQRVVRVGVARSLSLAHLPGFFSGKKLMGAKLKLVHPTGRAVIANVLSAQLDVGISSLGPRFPKQLQVNRQFDDEFVLIAREEPRENLSRKAIFIRWANEQQWILPPEGSNSRRILDAWLSERGLDVEAGMEMDSFDVMIQLVELGLGVAFVPRRALSAFRRGGNIAKIRLKSPPSRKVGVFTRKVPKPNSEVEEFVGGVLFS